MTHLRAVVHGLAEFENLGRLEPDPERQWRAAVSALFDGYASHGSDADGPASAARAGDVV